VKRGQLQLAATTEKTVEELLKDKVVASPEKDDKLPEVPESIVAVEGLRSKSDDEYVTFRTYNVFGLLDVKWIRF
jgi:hypothetical protein